MFLAGLHSCGGLICDYSLIGSESQLLNLKIHTNFLLYVAAGQHRISVLRNP